MVGIHVWLRVLSQLSPSIEVRLVSTVSTPPPHPVHHRTYWQAACNVIVNDY